MGPEDICASLNARHIRAADQGSAMIEGKLLLPMHSRNLEQALDGVFSPREWVAWEDEGGELYYGRFVRKLPTEHAFGLFEVLVSIGCMQELSAVRVYKFMSQILRPRSVQPTQQQYPVGEFLGSKGDGAGGAGQHDDAGPELQLSLADKIAKARDEIRKMFKLPEAERKRAFRRVCLAWHPDKNPGDVLDCTEVFKHIQNWFDAGPHKFFEEDKAYSSSTSSSSSSSSSSS